MRESLGKWVWAGLLAAGVYGVLDALWILVAGRTMFFSISEMLKTALWATLSTAGVGGLFGALAFVGFEPAARWLGRPALQRRKVLPRSLLALPLAALLFALFYALTQGPQASRIPFRLWIISALALVIGAALSWSLHALCAPHRRRLALALGIAVFAASWLADAFLLVRLYPVFHHALALLGAVSLAGGIRLVWRRPLSFRAGLMGGIVALVLLAAAVTSVAFIRQSLNPAYVIAQQTLNSRRLVRLSHRMFPAVRATDAAPLTAPSPGTAPADAPQLAPLSRPSASVFLLSVDAMRRDRLKPGSDDPVAPHLNRLAARSVVFERAYTPTPHTSYALSSLLTGKYTAALFNVPGAPEVHETWPQIMKRFGYATAGFFTRAVFFIDRPRFEPYLRARYGFDTADMEYAPTAAERVQQTMDFAALQKRAGRPVFSWTHFFEPHEPYDKDCTRFGTADERRYDCEIHTVDAALGTLFAYIDAEYPEAIVIVISDHGEEFGDHGGRYHGTTLYEEQAGVVLFIHVPQLAPKRVREPVNLVDLLGTVLSLVDIPVPARVRSQSLDPLLQGVPVPGRMAFAQLHDQRMAVRGDHKLIWDKAADTVALYDLAADPAETRSAAAQHPEVVAQLQREIQRWEASHAPWELRPIETNAAVAGEGSEARTGGWPVAIRQALANDPLAVPGLVALLDAAQPLPVRQKAASLLFALAPLAPSGALPSLDAEDDPVVRSWLLVHPSGPPRDEAARQLATLGDALPRFGELWMHGALLRMAQGERAAVPDLLEAVAHPEVSGEAKVEAIRLLGEQRVSEARAVLGEQIDNYPLALAVCTALGQIGHRADVPKLVARLKRERFVERRWVVAQALAQLPNSPDVVRALVAELSRPEPVPAVLSLLSKMPVGRGAVSEFRDADSEGRAAIFRRASVRLQARRLSALVLSGLDESAAVWCGDRQVARVDAPADVRESPEAPVWLSLSDCAAQGPATHIELRLTQADDHRKTPVISRGFIAAALLE
ncbi:MAG: sulfatase-like hydrolase/transferase [Myxococcales bacterium]|jgi:arylsulfatase A-like enzyme|nr:sulfatase-like hydrolase/transferase [Myxococcales bacterium]